MSSVEQGCCSFHWISEQNVYSIPSDFSVQHTGPMSSTSKFRVEIILSPLRHGSRRESNSTTVVAKKDESEPAQRSNCGEVRLRVTRFHRHFEAHNQLMVDFVLLVN